MLAGRHGRRRDWFSSFTFLIYGVFWEFTGFLELNFAQHWGQNEFLTLLYSVRLALLKTGANQVLLPPWGMKSLWFWNWSHDGLSDDGSLTLVYSIECVGMTTTSMVIIFQTGHLSLTCTVIAPNYLNMLRLWALLALGRNKKENLWIIIINKARPLQLCGCSPWEVVLERCWRRFSRGLICPQMLEEVPGAWYVEQECHLAPRR